jgi:hypothetical protein
VELIAPLVVMGLMAALMAGGGRWEPPRVTARRLVGGPHAHRRRPYELP